MDGRAQARLTIAVGPRGGDRHVQFPGIASTVAIAAASWLSLPCRSPSADKGTSTSGSTPLPSTIVPRHVYQPAAGNRRTNPWPTEQLPPPSNWPPVRVPTILANPFSAANAPTISPALNVCSLTSLTTRPWNGFGPKGRQQCLRRSRTLAVALARHREAARVRHPEGKFLIG